MRTNQTTTNERTIINIVTVKDDKAKVINRFTNDINQPFSLARNKFFNQNLIESILHSLFCKIEGKTKNPVDKTIYSIKKLTDSFNTGINLSLESSKDEIYCFKDTKEISDFLLAYLTFDLEELANYLEIFIVRKTLHSSKKE